MSDQFLRLVSRSAKFDPRSTHKATKHLELATPQKKNERAAAPASAQRTAAALDFFGSATPAAAASSSSSSHSTPSKSKAAAASAAASNGSKRSAGQKRPRDKSDREDDDEDVSVKREPQSDDDDDEDAAEEMQDDGGNDLDSADEDEDDGENGVQLFSGSRTQPDDDDDSGDEGGAHSGHSASSKRINALKAFRREAGIHVSGTDVPPPFRNFADLASLDVPEYLRRNLELSVEQEGCGYKAPTPIQQQAVPILLKGRELLACAPTGSGKTAAFVIPILTALKKPGKVGFRAVVLSPTRELAEQTHRTFAAVGRGRGFKVFHLNKANANSNSFGAQAEMKRDVLIATPMRLVHLIENGAIELSNVEWLILDEADRLFEEGFVGQVDTVLSALTNPSLRRAMFSATMMQGVESLARTVLRDPIRLTIGARNSATNVIKQKLVFVSSEDGKLVALRQMVQQGLDIPVLIFVQSKERAQQLYSELVFDALQVDVIHADRTPAQRTESIRRFRAGVSWVLICTDLMARGIDFLGVRTVINYDFPQSTVSYIHRIGRTGRAGREGTAITFFTEADKPLLHSVAKLVQQSGNDVPEWMLQMHKISTKKARKLQDQAPPRASIVQNPKNREANKKARDRKKKRKSEGKKQAGGEQAAASSADSSSGSTKKDSNFKKRKTQHNE